MRRSAAWISAIAALSAVLVSCEAPTGTRSPAAARLSLAPRFSEADAAIFAGLGAFALGVDNVHVIVRRGSGPATAGPVLKDTTIAFPSDQQELHVAIDVRLTAAREEVFALVELREGTTVYFSGDAVVEAQQGATTGSPEPVPMTYVGPGAGAAFLSMNLFQPTLAPSASVQFTATAYDAGEHVVSDLPITWSTSDATVATVSATGLVTSTGKIGTATITAKGLNGLEDATTLSVQPVARLALVSGDQQSAVAGLTLAVPFVVQALAAAGEPVIGAPIAFTALTAGGSATPATAITDLGGTASTAAKLGTAIGTYAFQASATGFPNVPAVSVSALALAGAPAAISILGDAQTQVVASVLSEPLVVTVKDALGNPVSGVNVAWHVASGVALLYPEPQSGRAGATDLTQPTGTDGASRVRVELGTVAGAVTVTAALPGTTLNQASFALTAVAGAASQLLVVREPSSTAQATIAFASQPVVRLADQYGNFVAKGGVRISASRQPYCTPSTCRVGVVAASALSRPNLSAARQMSVPTALSATKSIADTITRGLVGSVDQITDANGVATFTDLALNEYVAQWQIQFFDATQSLAATLSKPIDLVPGPARSMIASPDTIHTIATTVVPFARVQDAVGNGVAGVRLSWDNKGGSLGRLDSLITTTDASGYSGPGLWTLPGTLGIWVLTVSTVDGLKLENEPLPIVAQIP